METPQKPGPMTSPLIYDFVDYREYLSAWLSHPGRRISQAGFARKAGTSPSLVSMIRKGERTLDPVRGREFAAAMRLDPAETSYWLDLIELDHGASRQHQQEAWIRITGAQRFLGATSAVASTTALFGQWFYAVLVTAVRCDGFVEDSEAIARQLGPTLGSEQVAAAFEHLEQLGILARDQDGRLRVGSDVRTTHAIEDDVLAKSVRQVHQAWLSQASRALDEVPHEQRQYGAFTLAVSERRYAELRQRIQAFLQELAGYAESDVGADRVVQVNMQAFPVWRVDQE